MLANETHRKESAIPRLRSGIVFNEQYNDPFIGRGRITLDYNFIPSDSGRMKTSASGIALRPLSESKAKVCLDSHDTIVAYKNTRADISIVNDRMNSIPEELIPETSNKFVPDITLGGDIEFLLGRDGDTFTTINAPSVLEVLSGTDQSHMIRSDYTASIGVDGGGFLGEIRFPPVKTAAGMANAIIKRMEVLLSAVENMQGHSIVVFTGGGSGRYRNSDLRTSIGGHIHFGGMPVNGVVVHLIDHLITAPLDSARGGLRHGLSDPEAETPGTYGAFKSYRQQPWGVKIRSPPSWLFSPEMIKIVSQVTYDIGQFYRKYILLPQEEPPASEIVHLVREFRPKSYYDLKSYVMDVDFGNPVNDNYPLKSITAKGFGLSGYSKVFMGTGQRRSVIVYGSVLDTVSYYSDDPIVESAIKKLVGDVPKIRRSWMRNGVIYIGLPMDSRKDYFKVLEEPLKKLINV